MSPSLLAPRQRLRSGLMLVWLLIMPVTLYYFSPYLPFMGLMEGLISGSVFVFVGLFASATVLGRAFCGWVCPAGAAQDVALLARPQAMKNRAVPWIKFVLWAPWMGAWIGLAASSVGLRPDGLKPDFFYQLEGGISVTRPAAYAIYLSVLSLILALAFLLGRRGFCHASCWMAPFLVLGQKLGQVLRIPGLHLRSDVRKCTACGTCSLVCPMSLDVGAMAKHSSEELRSKTFERISHRDCILCMRCADACPTNVLRAGFGVRT